MGVTPQFDFSLLRGLRKRQALTIGEVAEQSGISAAVISRLERNQSKAELDTLYRLARVYGLSAADLIGLAEAPFAHRALERTHTSGGFAFRQVRYANVRVMRGTAAAGDRISRPEIHSDDLEVCWILEGRLRIVLPHEVCILEKGESIQFDAILEHTYEALRDCEFILLHLRKDKRY